MIKAYEEKTINYSGRFFSTPCVFVDRYDIDQDDWVNVKNFTSASNKIALLRARNLKKQCAQGNELYTIRVYLEEERPEIKIG